MQESDAMRPFRGISVALGALAALCTPCALAVSASAQARFGLEPSLKFRQAQMPDDGEVHVLPVQGNVYMLVGAGGNIAVQIGDEGVLLVDTGNGKMTDKVLAAVRKLSDKPIRYIVNTHAHPDHTGGNGVLAKAGSTTRGGPAEILAHENVMNRMSAPLGRDLAAPPDAWPTDTFFPEEKDFFFNEEAVMLYHDPAAHTDGDTIVFFRRSDVVVAGDIFVTTSYPVIDAPNGGSVFGIISGLNRILDLTVPKHEQEGGTYVIPGHGHLCDESEVLEFRDMLVIVKERIEDMVKRGMTLDQVKAARPTLDYDLHYGAESGPWTTAMFIEAVYRDVSKAAAGQPPASAQARVQRQEMMICVPMWLRHDRRWMAALAVAAVAIGSFVPAAAQQTVQRTAKAAAPFDPAGYWVPLVTEDWRFRMVTPPKGDYASVPLNPEGRRVADTWDLAKDNASGTQCKAYGVGGIMRQPGRLHVTWQDDNTLKMEFDAGGQVRLLHFSPAGPAGEPTWQGNSVAEWDLPVAAGRGGGGGQGRGAAAGRGAPAGPRGGALKVTTTGMKAGYLRKNGAPYSEIAVVTEYIDRLGPEPDGAVYLLVRTMVDDPKYLQQPFVTSTHFRFESDGAAKWNPTPCRTDPPGLAK